MTVPLIVNADDVGLHVDIDRGISACISARVVNSVSVCVVGQDLDWVRVRDMAEAGVAVGLHVTWVGESMLTDMPAYGDWKALILGLLANPKRMLQVCRAEMDAQYDAFIQAFGRPSHIDSHQHVHTFPGLWGLSAHLAKASKCRLRWPKAASKLARKASFGGQVLHLMATRKQVGVDAVPCIGIRESGHYTTDSLLAELASVQGRAVEMVVHPAQESPGLHDRYGGWQYAWEQELNALLDERFKKGLDNLGFALPFEGANSTIEGQ